MASAGFTSGYKFITAPAKIINDKNKRLIHYSVSV